MLPYLLYVSSPIWVYLIIWGGSASQHKGNKVNINTYLNICVIIMIAMIGFRSELNGSRDTYRYGYFWSIIRDTPISGLSNMLNSIDMEKGYLLTVFVLTRVFSDPQWQLIITGTFFAVTICSFFKKNCNGSPLALLAFNALGTFNFMVQGLRQSIAMCICLWAFEQIKERHYIKATLFVALAGTFHGSAYVYLVIIILSIMKLKLNFKSMIFFGLCTVIGLIFISNIFQIMGIILDDDYTKYPAAESGGIVAILIYLTIIIFGMIVGDKKDKDYAIFVYMALIGMVCMILRNTVSMFADRVSQYFAFGQMVILALSVKQIQDNNIKFIIELTVVTLLFIIAGYKASYSTLIPYNFFWD